MASSPEMPAAIRSQTKSGTDSPPELPQGVQPGTHLGFCSVKQEQDCDQGAEEGQNSHLRNWVHDLLGARKGLHSRAHSDSGSAHQTSPWFQGVLSKDVFEFFSHTHTHTHM